MIQVSDNNTTSIFKLKGNSPSLNSTFSSKTVFQVQQKFPLCSKNCIPNAFLYQILTTPLTAALLLSLYLMHPHSMSHMFTEHLSGPVVRGQLEAILLTHDCWGYRSEVLRGPHCQPRSCLFSPNAGSLLMLFLPSETPCRLSMTGSSSSLKNQMWYLLLWEVFLESPDSCFNASIFMLSFFLKHISYVILLI